jgi:uncharacterized protein YggE
VSFPFMSILNSFVLKATMACAIATTLGTTLGCVIPKSSQAATFTPSSAPSSGATSVQSELQLAQAAPLSARTLTVTGNGNASAPADQAALVFSYSSNYFPTPTDASTPDAVPTPPPALQASDLKMVTDALTGAGVSANDITIVPEPYSNQSLRMTVRVNNPSSERISRLVDAANAAATKDNKFMGGVSGAIFVARDCKSAEAKARELAMADARAQAQSLASTANVAIGDLISVTGTPNYSFAGPFPSSTCPTSLDEALRYSTYMATPYDPSLPVEVSFGSSVSLTYEMK